MSYQVLARKWRPQRFEDVVGQRAVTQTLRNAITGQRIAQAYVFAGPRGVGKTTTARILARALNCVEGPTPDPCGRCDACVEIAEGRDIDVLEIDAATHTQVENVRNVIISGLAIPPVRDRYKVFVIDEVHQLSGPSFNALLKSVEEPPPHVAFVMATTELRKVPVTIQSRSQVFEFRLIPSQAIADQLRKIVQVEALDVSDEALSLIVRSADGSLRDAETALDQVIAFAAGKVTLEDAATVLGAVGRDLLFDIVAAVADEDGLAAFELTRRALETGSDLKRVTRELSKMVRDLMVLKVDSGRLTDPEIAAEGERERIRALAARFSKEDLLRAFDVLAAAETDLNEARNGGDPRFRFEMALLKWIHLRKLVPLEQLIERLQSGGGLPGSKPQGGSAAGGSRPGGPSRTAPSPIAPPARGTAGPGQAGLASPGPGGAGSGAAVRGPGGGTAPGAPPPPTRSPQLDRIRRTLAERGPVRPAESGPEPARARPPDAGNGPGLTREAFLSEIGRNKPVLFNTVVAQAQRIDVGAERIVFTFSAGQETLKATLDQQRDYLDAVAAHLAGRKVPVSAITALPTPGSHEPDAALGPRGQLRARALADPAVQALLDVFPADIRDVEEMDG